MDIKDLEEMIEIRVNPHIYAFSTNTIPRYLKVGDTFRGVDTRIKEWSDLLAKRLEPQEVKLKKEYSASSLLSKDIYFRDYEVHKYLSKIGKKRIEDPEMRNLYSQEFFADTNVDDIEAAIKDIEDDYNSVEVEKKYGYYSVSENKSATIHGVNDKDWKLRPNQETVVKAFLAKQNQSELLMYAVMRFGKSFTAM